MIQSFGDAATSGVFNGVDSRVARRLPRNVWPVIRRKLDMLDAAVSRNDLLAPPGNRLEALKGERAGDGAFESTTSIASPFVSSTVTPWTCNVKIIIES